MGATTAVAPITRYFLARYLTVKFSALGSFGSQGRLFANLIWVVPAAEKCNSDLL